METNVENKVWTQTHFNELFQEAPKIQTLQTYSTIKLILDSQTIQVKVPSGSDEQTYKYLISKYIYYHYLDKKDANPLLKVATFSMFECVDGFQNWYRLWMRGEGLIKKSCVYGQSYRKNKGIGGYKAVARVGGEGRLKFLARSRKNGKYYNMTIIQNKNISREELQLLHDHYKKQHPFVTHLCQYAQYHQFTYFIFQHHPFSARQVLTQISQPLNKEAKFTLFV